MMLRKVFIIVVVLFMVFPLAQAQDDGSGTWQDPNIWGEAETWQDPETGEDPGTWEDPNIWGEAETWEYPGTGEDPGTWEDPEIWGEAETWEYPDTWQDTGTWEDPATWWYPWTWDYPTTDEEPTTSEDPILEEEIEPLSESVTELSIRMLTADEITVAPVVQVSSDEAGRIQDGYLSGATVFADADGDGEQDLGEASDTTDALGRFELVQALGDLVAIGGTDISTQLAHTTVLKAPAGSTVVNPLTTLVNALVQTGVSVAQAQTQVVEKLGLPVGVTLTSFDPLQTVGSATASAAEKAAAVAVYKVSTLIANVLTQTAAAVTGAATNLKTTDASEAAAISIANLITAASAPIDLSRADTLRTVLMESARSMGTEAAVARVADQVSAVMAATNAEVVQVEVSGTNFSEALSSVVKAQVVAQGSAAQALATAVNSGEAATLTDSFTGAALSNRVTNATVGNLGLETVISTSGAGSGGVAGGKGAIFSETKSVIQKMNQEAASSEKKEEASSEKAEKIQLKEFQKILEDSVKHEAVQERKDTIVETAEENAAQEVKTLAFHEKRPSDQLSSENQISSSPVIQVAELYVDSVPPGTVIDVPSGKIKFQGQAEPFDVVLLLVQSVVRLRATVIADEEGYWEWETSVSLTAEQHQLSVVTIDPVTYKEKTRKNVLFRVTQSSVPIVKAAEIESQAFRDISIIIAFPEELKKIRQGQKFEVPIIVYHEGFSEGETQKFEYRIVNPEGEALIVDAFEVSLLPDLKIILPISVSFEASLGEYLLEVKSSVDGLLAHAHVSFEVVPETEGLPVLHGVSEQPADQETAVYDLWDRRLAVYIVIFMIVAAIAVILHYIWKIQHEKHL